MGWLESAASRKLKPTALTHHMWVEDVGLFFASVGVVRVPPARGYLGCVVIPRPSLRSSVGGVWINLPLRGNSPHYLVAALLVVVIGPRHELCCIRCHNT